MCVAGSAGVRMRASSRSKWSVEPVYLKAIIMGLCIGVVAMLLDLWVGERGWRARGAALLLAGGLLCLLQYGLIHFRRRR